MTESIETRVARLEGTVATLTALLYRSTGPSAPEQVNAARPVSPRVQAGVSRVAKGLPRDVALSLQQSAWQMTQEGIEDGVILRRIENGEGQEKVRAFLATADV